MSACRCGATRTTAQRLCHASCALLPPSTLQTEAEDKSGSTYFCAPIRGGKTTRNRLKNRTVEEQNFRRKLRLVGGDAAAFARRKIRRHRGAATTLMKRRDHRQAALLRIGRGGRRTRRALKTKTSSSQLLAFASSPTAAASALLSAEGARACGSTPIASDSGFERVSINVERESDVLARISPPPPMPPYARSAAS